MTNIHLLAFDLCHMSAIREIFAKVGDYALLLSSPTSSKMSSITVAPPRIAGTITWRYTVSVTWVDLWPTVSLISWMGTPLLLMIDTAVCRASWACQWPMPAFLVILEKRQLSASDVYALPLAWQNTRLLACQASPTSRRSRSCLVLCALRAPIARLGMMSERFDFGVLVSPVLLAERQTWTTPPLRSTWSQVSLRSSPGRRPSVMART